MASHALCAIEFLSDSPLPICKDTRAPKSFEKVFKPLEAVALPENGRVVVDATLSDHRYEETSRSSGSYHSALPPGHRKLRRRTTHPGTPNACADTLSRQISSTAAVQRLTAFIETTGAVDGHLLMPPQRGTFRLPKQWVCFSISAARWRACCHPNHQNTLVLPPVGQRRPCGIDRFPRALHCPARSAAT